MFATLVLEHEPTRWTDLPEVLGTWTKGVGGMAAVALVVWLVVYLTRQSRAPAATDAGEKSSPLPLIVGALAAVALIGYALAGIGILQGKEGEGLLHTGLL